MTVRRNVLFTSGSDCQSEATTLFSPSCSGCKPLACHVSIYRIQHVKCEALTATFV